MSSGAKKRKPRSKSSKKLEKMSTGIMRYRIEAVVFLVIVVVMLFFILTSMTGIPKAEG